MNESLEEKVTRWLGGGPCMNPKKNQSRSAQQLSQEFDKALRASMAEAAPTAPAPSSREVIVGPVLAYRQWHVKYGQLASVVADYTWPVGKPAEGESQKGTSTYPGVLLYANFGLPEPKKIKNLSLAECGIHAYRTLASAGWGSVASFGRHTTITGGVWLWGDVNEYDNGYLARKAYPAFLLLEDEKINENAQVTWNDTDPLDLRSYHYDFGLKVKKIAAEYNVPVVALRQEQLKEDLTEQMRERFLFDEAFLPREGTDVVES
jgi:hypothetical protein